ncbi:cyclin-dependent kinase 2-interacting protein [Cimex lectularius]|uniref:Cyclin-dependent kinase 2-interacting protein n=1 Tax=Cimex lectularius TaxID=79782 RepID=A0A8I6RAV3_CIMLE|nr:cyclin-dependent kinase 2-interacting protein [Cimex lectularius]
MEDSPGCPRHYSPVVVHESPSWTQKNLTGIARQLKDNSADLYNCVQRWNQHHLAGMKVLNNIRDLKCSAIEKKAENLDLYPEGLQKLCYTLSDLFDQMSEEVNLLKVINKQYEALQKLQDLKENYEPVFMTWQLHHFVEVSRDVAESYEKQLELNNYTKENIAFSTNPDSIDFYRISWLYQPLIDENLDFQIESLLKETGLK